MNTINPVRPYVSLRNNPQPTTNPVPQAPAFKGALGNEVVKKIATKKNITVTGILAMATGLFSLSKNKVNDIIESLVDRINDLQDLNEMLDKENDKVRNLVKQKETEMRAELTDNERRLRDSFSTTLKQKTLKLQKKMQK